MKPIRIDGGNGRRYRIREIRTYQLEGMPGPGAAAWIPLGAPSLIVGECQRMALTIEREIYEDQEQFARSMRKLKRGR